MPSKKSIQLKIGELERKIKELKRMFYEHYGYYEPLESRPTIWKDIGQAWKDMNDSIKVPQQICFYCGRKVGHLRLYCACGHAFCSMKCSEQYHKERKHE